ncbi:MAG: hypothetical protein LUG50_07305 [Planctomycetaceae bacterium]|nr:hypothetical protein [Planctomycetaceae bacterium]
MKLYSYIVVSDTGFAPNPYHGFCTLACCKPRIRKTASEGDWVVGLTPKPRGHQLIFAMKIQETMLMNEYWLDTRFARKRPDFKSDLGSRGDNIYEPMPDGSFRQHRSWHSMRDERQSSISYKRFIDVENPKTKEHDLRISKRVLIASEFVYFGTTDAVELPRALREALAVGIGHRSNFPPEIISFWQSFIATQPRGIQCNESHALMANRQCCLPPSKTAGRPCSCR